MGIFSNTPNKDDKIAALENDAQERMKRIGSLRAQIAQLTSEEKTVVGEFENVQIRTASLRQQRDALINMKSDAEALERDIEQRKEKQLELNNKFNALSIMRQKMMPEIAALRAQISKEEAEAKKDKLELEDLKNQIAANVARKQEIMDNTIFMNKATEELKELEEKFKSISEQLPVIRKKYNQTKLLVESMENDIAPVAESIRKIWKSLPDDVLDKRLNLNRLNIQINS